MLVREITILPSDERPASALVVHLKFPDEASWIRCIDKIADLVSALDALYRAHGGAGVIVKADTVQRN